MKNSEKALTRAQAFLMKAHEADAGSTGKAFELAIRTYLSGRNAGRVKMQGKADYNLTLDGKRRTVEIKTACGDVMDSLKADFVVYAPNYDPEEPAETQGYVFTRSEWSDFLNGYTGRGSLLREPEGSPRRHIQSFYWSEEVRPKASKPLGNYIMEACLDKPTVEEVWERG